ncbi:MAG: Uncharacterized protein Greene101449_289 [Candidatus Peregrinibacteria bacterium Greene1014_49]|nr:MAG: Uncharacterized protein Greene101449_289 [Candidatus Peregrinibacteria bacterium Greene1014_49]
MLRIFLATHRIRRSTRAIRKIASTCAILFGLGILTLAQASVYSGPGIDSGVTTAQTTIPGVSATAPSGVINSIITQAISYSNILAFAVIVIAGFYLILGLGNETSKETARKIILYTGVGLVIINLAAGIRDFLEGVGPGTSASGGATALDAAINTIIGVFTSYTGLLAFGVISIAAFYLILGLGNESSKGTARSIILYTGIGLVIMSVTAAIRNFLQGIATGTSTSGGSTALDVIINGIIGVFTSYTGLLAFAVIVIAGFYLILGLGNESSKGTARNIVLYTGIGLVIISLAPAIRNFFFSINAGTSGFGGSTSLNLAINAIINTFKSYVGILALAVIIIAGFYLILGLGNESSKGTARNIILYTGIGLIIINLAVAITAFLGGIVTSGAGTSTSGAGGTTGLDVAIDTIIGVLKSYVGILALAMIVIAGFYLILGLGNESSKGTARSIIIYTGVGLIIITLGVGIRNFLGGIVTNAAGGSTSGFGGLTGLNVAINAIIDVFTSYVGLLAVAVIVIAGFYLILGLGNESSKGTAKNIILYTAVGIIVIILANVIVSFFQSIPSGVDASGLYGTIRTIIVYITTFAALLAVAAIVIGGIMLITSIGDEGRKDTAKKVILYAIIGLFVIALSSAFVHFVFDIF